MLSELRPLSSDRKAALALARRAILSRNDSDAETGPFLSMVEREIANDSAFGALRYDADRVGGIAVWEPPNELGATLQVVFLIEGEQTATNYRTFYEEIQGVAGPVVLAPGHLAGLSDADEDRVMEGLEFARFSRSEMRYPPESPAPDGAPDPTVRLRVAAPDDQPALARLHERAYRDHFDRFLFLADPDPVRDADVAMRDILGGRWGEFLGWASAVAEGDGDLSAATLVVRASYGPLIADVMVDPHVQGRGLGRAVLAASIRALRDRNESVIVLNVTEGNARANRLYERMGFVRSLGPSHGWYSKVRIPVSPDLD